MRDMIKVRDWRAFVIAALVLVGLASAGANHGFAHKGASGIVKERMDAMKSLKGDMKAISDMFRGRTAYKNDEVKWRADRIKAHGRDFERLFPSGSTDGPSEASPRIWSEWSRFMQQTGDMTAAARGLMNAARDKTAARKAFGELGQTCRTCHDDYRLEKP